MTIKLNNFATDWGNLLQAYTSNSSFQCSSGKVVKVNNRYKIILSNPCSEVLKLDRPILTRTGISHICQEITIKSDQIEVLEKISQSFDCICTQLKQRLAAERPPLKYMSVRFSKWFTYLWWDRHLLAKILIVATFGIFYFIWKRGRAIEKRYNGLSSEADSFAYVSKYLKEKINAKKSSANLVLSINANKEGLPLPVMGIIFNYLNTRERKELVKEWDIAREVVHVSRQFQTELIQKYQKLLSPLRDTFKTEMQRVDDLEEYFKWNLIPIETDYSDTDEWIRFAIFSCFGASEDNISGLKYLLNFTERAMVEKFKVHLQHKEFAILFAQTSPTVLEFVPKDIKGYREVVLEAVAHSNIESVLKYASEDLKNDKEVVLRAVEKDGYALFYASEELKKDKEVALRAVKRNEGAFKYASKTLQNDKEFVLQALSSNICSFKYVSPDLKIDVDVVSKVLDQDFQEFYKHGDLAVLEERKILLKALSKDTNCDLWMKIQGRDAYRKDKELVYAAVGANGKALQWVSVEFWKDPELILLGLKTCDESLNFASEELQNDREFILKAVGVNGNALRWAPEEFRNDPEFLKEIGKKEQPRNEGE